MRVEGSPTPPQPDETHRIGGAHAVAIIDAWSSADRVGALPIGSGCAADDAARARTRTLCPYPPTGASGQGTASTPTATAPRRQRLAGGFVRSWRPPQSQGAPAVAYADAVAAAQGRPGATSSMCGPVFARSTRVQESAFANAVRSSQSLAMRGQLPQGVRSASLAKRARRVSAPQPRTLSSSSRSRSTSRASVSESVPRRAPVMSSRVRGWRRTSSRASAGGLGSPRTTARARHERESPT